MSLTRLFTNETDADSINISSITTPYNKIWNFTKQTDLIIAQINNITESYNYTLPTNCSKATTSIKLYKTSISSDIYCDSGVYDSDWYLIAEDTGELEQVIFEGLWWNGTQILNNSYTTFLHV